MDLSVAGDNLVEVVVALDLAGTRRLKLPGEAFHRTARARGLFGKPLIDLAAVGCMSPLDSELELIHTVAAKETFVTTHEKQTARVKKGIKPHIKGAAKVPAALSKEHTS